MSNGAAARGRLPSASSSPGLWRPQYVYWVGTHQESLEELLPGSRRLTQRQVGLLYGHGGQIIYEWIQDAKDPAVEAGMIVLGAAAAAFLYRRASLPDETHNRWP